MNTSDTAQTTANTPSVEDRLSSWLTGTADNLPQEEDQQPDALADDAEAQSEASEDETPDPEAKVADEDGAEDDEDTATDDEADGTEEGAQQLVTVKIDGKEEQLPLDEVIKGYQRQQDYTRKTMELAEERKEFQSEAEAISEERQQYAQLLQALSQQLESQMQQEPDWDELYQQNPAAYVREKARWDDMKERRQAAQAEMQRVSQMQEQQNRQRLMQQLQSERERMLEAVPDWKDEKKFDAARKAVRDYGKALGFSDEELSQVFDHRAVLALWKASQYDALVSNKPEGRKPEGPKAARAGAARNAPSQASGYKKARQRLAKSGSLDDAAALMRSLI